MLFYLLKRLAAAVPVLLAVSLGFFALSRLAPGDQVDVQSSLQFSQNQGNTDPDLLEKQYDAAARRFGLDRPAFYFTWTTAIFPDTFFRIVKPEARKTRAALLEKTGNWPAVQAWAESIKQTAASLEKLPDSLGPVPKIQLRKNLQNLRTSANLNEIEFILTENESTFSENPLLKTAAASQFSDLKNHFTRLQTSQPGLQNWLPAFFWHGLDNQYHAWLKKLMTGQLGTSIVDSRPVREKIGEALRITLAINLTAILLAYLIAVPLGVFSARRAGKRAERGLQFALLAIWSMPIFWLATMAVVFFTTPTFGMPIFPSIGLGDLPADAPFWARFREKASHLVLPILLLTTHSLAFLTRQMRSSVLTQLPELYIRTARAKGLSERAVFWKHALPNALFPLITLFAGLLPATIAGALVIEVIFAIPGMGQLAIQSFFSRDWSVVFAILMLTAVLTILGNLFADLLYAWADPRVSY